MMDSSFYGFSMVRDFFRQGVGAAYMRPAAVRRQTFTGKPAGRVCPAPTALFNGIPYTLLAYRKFPRLKSPEFKFFVKMLRKGCALLKRVLN
jgi:hypothetical protein